MSGSGPAENLSAKLKRDIVVLLTAGDDIGEAAVCPLTAADGKVYALKRDLKNGRLLIPRPDSIPVRSVRGRGGRDHSSFLKNGAKECILYTQALN